MKPPLLFLCHRIPYPPNKGDKIRAWHLLRHLAAEFDVHLATFVDDPADWQHIETLRELCATTFFAPLIPWRATVASVTGFATGEALSLPYYRSAGAGLADWVARCAERENVRHAMVYSSAMAQFLPSTGGKPGDAIARKVIDFVDVDSDKWLQYSVHKPWPLSWVYRREGQRLLDCERALAVQFDYGLFVSSAEAALFRRLAPESAHKVGHYNNGVDTDYFRPDPTLADPFDGAPTLVFTGAMDYWPNVDAVVDFAEKILPTLQKAQPLRLCIVGGNPSDRVQALGKSPGICVTGRVPDVRPYLQHALAAIAPMRVARGVQNKVLEGMAMAKPILVSALGLEGIDATDGEHLLLAETADDYARHLDALQRGEHAGLGERARAYVSCAFNWDDNLPEVALLLRGEQAASQKNSTCAFAASGLTSNPPAAATSLRGLS
ncbi:TIGR03087 family PEP-CTERM/XrtA system glycosyltransferase [Chromatocurvus halotolerans]|uniref:Sugar transferase (PEP-CTERM/EpsH1 system associated) n=1 Tax=Chromatocurvus halotolerans TaxID=1132028 RepID=A0A4R2KNN2_9GAMM|nr:TIGR03087 family PEP-CTERM/XrtA system glycosyltransferase [Chromatocurvus halotolerans]TCO74322.1 sugar transferase (PEP-CTERM/EpsH1 system associated) [Chromatocurvus halotolerans]